MIFVWSPAYFAGFVGLNVPEYAINTMYNLFSNKMAEYKQDASGKYYLVSPRTTPATEVPLSPVQSYGDINQGTSYSTNRTPFGGGITVETNNDSVTGPMASLYKNKYAYTSLVYPLDAGSIGKGHTVQFDISDIKPVELKDIGSTIDNEIQQLGRSFGTLSAAQNTVTSAANKIIDFATQGAEYVKNNSTGKIVEDAVEAFGNAPRLNYGPEVTKTVSTIRLSMPDTLNFSYEVQYDKLSVADAAGSVVPLVGTIARAITSGIGKMGLNKLGYVFNPQEQQIFEGIEFREYEMTFVFTPVSEREANTVKEIIKTFRKYAAPTINNKLSGFFFTPPSVFDVSFFFNGQPNHNLNPIRRSVVTNITVDYAPNGWAALRNGAPVQTTMTVSFRETELVDRTSIESEK
jgi:hypothetical protein